MNNTPKDNRNCKDPHCAVCNSIPENYYYLHGRPAPFIVTEEYFFTEEQAVFIMERQKWQNQLILH